MQITFDHTDLANPEALSILRRVIGGADRQSADPLPSLEFAVRDLASAPIRKASEALDAATGGVVESVVKGFVKTALDGLAGEVVKLRELETPAPTPAELATGYGMPADKAAALFPPVPAPSLVFTKDGASLVEAPEVVDDSILDSAGIMWDARIHASTRTKVADGTWKMKRGVEPELVAQVMAELKGQTKVEAFAAQVDPSTLGFGAVPTPPAPPAPATVAAVPVPPVPAVLADTSDWPADLLGPHRPGFEFQAFMNYVMGRVNAGIPTPTLLATCKEHDVASFSAVNGRPEVIPALARALSQLVKEA